MCLNVECYKIKFTSSCLTFRKQNIRNKHLISHFECLNLAKSRSNPVIILNFSNSQVSTKCVKSSIFFLLPKVKTLKRLQKINQHKIMKS